MNKTEVIKARVMAEEKRVFLKLCRMDRRKPSEMLRELVRQEAKRRGLWPPK